MKLRIADNLSLPVDSVTQTFAILGIRGSGKTNTAVAMAEEMLKLNQQVVVLDPTDAWYGIRSSRDGKSAGFQIYVMGGEHGDIPLEGSNGIAMAEFVVDTGAAVVFSLRHLSISNQRRFAQDFAERLYDLKGKAGNRTPLHIFVDEADEFIPQRIPKGFERMFGAYDRLVRRGRSSGIGLTMISQRPQVINKDTLSQCEILVCHRLLHKLDRKAVKEGWVEGHDLEGKVEEFMSSLASLARGEAWFWSPSWLDIFRKVQVRARETFDSSFTPKAGEKPKIAKALAPVDLEALKQKLATTIEKAKADDPKELKRKIAELQKAARLPVAQPQAKSDPRAIERAVKEATTPLLRQIAEFKKLASASIEAFTRATAGLNSIANVDVPTVTAPSPRPVAAARPVQVISRKPAPESSNGHGDLSGPEQRILNAIAWLNTIGVEQPEQTAVAFLAGYTVGGGAFNNPRGRLNQRGLVRYLSGDKIELTDEGHMLAQAPDSPLTAGEMQRMVLDMLPGPEKKILSELLKERDGISNDELAQRSGYAPGGGAFNNPRGRLRTLGLIDYQGGRVVPRSLLFLEA